MIKSFLCLLFISNTFAITYSVISPAKSVAVLINQTIYPLTPSAESYLLHQGPAPADSPYTFILHQNLTPIQSEPFQRPAVSSDTPYHFYGRVWKDKSLISFPAISSIPKRFDRRPDHQLHSKTEIPTIHVVTSPADLDNIHKNYLKDINISANVTFIRSSSVQVFKDAKFELGGRSSRLLTKYGYNIKLNKKNKDSIDGFTKLKLRTNVVDPSYMRDYLNSDMMYALNQPASRASFVRVFLNERPVGLYTLMEKYDDGWLANEFAAGATNYPHGILYEGQGGKTSKDRSSLAYLGDQSSLYQNKAYSISEKPKVGSNSLDDLVEFIKFIHDQLEFQKVSNNSLISSTRSEWEKRLEVEGFLVSMAIAFMNGYSDDYLHNTNNYFLYKSPTDSKFHYISWDYDLTLGNGPISIRKLAIGNYKKFSGFDLRPLTVALLRIPEYRTLFESRLESIARTFYDPVISNKVIDSVVDFIQEDVAWDKSLPHIKKRLEMFPYTIYDLFHLGSNNVSNNNQGLPLDFSLATSADYLIRINSDVSFKKAIEGNTRHLSLKGIKEWFSEKLENYNKR